MNVLRFATTGIAGATLILSTSISSAAEIKIPVQPPRWVQADDVRVRAAPSLEGKVIGVLPQGAELILKAQPVEGDFCLIEGEGQYGYVACQYLSAERVARPKAGEGGVDIAQRWVTGNSVVLREAARSDAPVIGRLSLNTIIKLVREVPGSGYCEVQPANSPSGYTACRYLAVTPASLARIQGVRYGNEAVPAEYDPVRAFWLEPSWGALYGYVMELQSKRSERSPQDPRSRDEELEKMKAHLALGIKGGKSEPYADWAELKRKAAQDMDLSNEFKRLRAQGKPVTHEVSLRAGRVQSIAIELQRAIGIWGVLHEAISIEGEGAIRTVQLVRALEFPDIQPSWFRSEASIAPPITNAEAASGRFNIVFRQLTTPRPRPDTNPMSQTSNAGFYDMLTRTSLLVKPVQRVQLLRDGGLQSEASLLRNKTTLWYEVDEPECAGWQGGFSFGDAESSIWGYFDNNDPMRKNAMKQKSASRLYAFYTNLSLPRASATLTQTQVKMNREETGFVQGTHLHYDLDGDGIPDISVWEGRGRGPGHLEEISTKTDDRWYRLVLVNIDGKWKVLGSDVFSYGCGC